MNKQKLSQYCQDHYLKIYEVTKLTCYPDEFFDSNDPQAYVDDVAPDIYLELVNESNHNQPKVIMTGDRDDIINYLKAEAGDQNVRWRSYPNQ